jgi:predicted RNA-binding Zn-ribbon protein involved in translation (DUF1610 family)
LLSRTICHDISLDFFTNMSEQLRVITLKCANCGGALEIQTDMDQFSCGYCGSEQTVVRRGGTVALRLVVDAVARVQSGTDRTAAELALARLEKEIATVHAQWQDASADFARRNSYNSTPAMIGIVGSVTVGVIALNTFANAAGPGPDGPFALSLLILVTAIVGLVLSIKLNSKAHKTFTAKRAELWRPYAERIEALESSRRKHRQVVDQL